MGGYKWTQDEETVLEEKYGYKPIVELAEDELERRTEGSIKSHANSMGLESNKRDVNVWKMQHTSRVLDDFAFNHYIVGLVDGEGCFTYREESRDWDSTSFTLQIKMKDEEYILQKVRDYFDCGQIYNYGEMDEWQVTSSDELGGVIIPFFKTYPPRARKKKQFNDFVEEFEDFFNIEYDSKGLIRRIE